MNFISNIKIKLKRYTITVVLVIIILFSGYVHFFNDYFYESAKNYELERKTKVSEAYNPLYEDFLFINEINDAIYNFNAKDECYILAEVDGIDFTRFVLDEKEYNVSYGLNYFPIDFGDDFTSHSIEFDQPDVIKWICVEPLFIAEDNITVNLKQETNLSFYAGGPISMLLQPNFSYNWLYLKVDDTIINNIYNTSYYPEIESSFYSYFIEDGSYLQFDLDMEPKNHTVKIKGNGSIEYKFLVNLDWDQDLIDDADEVQKELFYDELDPTIPNIWGCFEKSNEYSFIPNSVENKTGYFYFYIPESKGDTNFLSIDLYSGTVFEVIIDEDFSTFIDLVLRTNYQSNPVTHFCRKLDPGHHYVQYKYDISIPIEISFRINHQKILVLEKSELKDSDCDGLKDQEELASGLDPNNSDTDEDFLPDNLDPSPLVSLTLKQNNIYQIVLPHNASKDSIIEFNLKKPIVDYSTNGLARKWHDSLEVNIVLVLRIFGNKSMMRDDLVQFWKGHKNYVQEYNLVKDYVCTGATDAIPHPQYPYSEYNLIIGSPSVDTIYYEIEYPKGHPAKEDNVIDIRFDFIWLVTKYDVETRKSQILHFYDVQEDLILESMMYREYGKVNYIVGSPDSMIENQMLWAITQNSHLSNTLNYDLTNDIKYQGLTDYLDLGTQLMIDRGIGVFPATYGFENEDLSTWNLLGEDGAYFNVIDEFKGHIKVLSIHDIQKSNEIVFPRAEQYFEAPQKKGTIEFWFATSDRRKNYSYILLSDSKLLTGIIRIGGLRGDVQYYQRGFYIGFEPFYIYVPLPKWTTIGYIESNKWHHMKISFKYPKDQIKIYLDGHGSSLPYSFSLAPIQNGEGIKKISFSVQNDFSIEKTFYIDALDYSWDINYEKGRNKEPIYNIDNPSLNENEVIYVAGSQKNSDILNKISLLEKYQNPSQELLNSKDFIIYSSHYSITNLYSSNNYTFFDEESRGDHKICYTKEFIKYSNNDQQYYEQRANIQGYPIDLQVIPFQNSKVLKISQVIGSNIPLNNIPRSESDQLHDKIILHNQIYIEKIESEYIILPIHFSPTKDIYKSSIDNRIWELESSKLLFTVDITLGSFAEKLSNQVKNFRDFSKLYIKSTLKILKALSKRFNKILDKLWVVTFDIVEDNLVEIGNLFKAFEVMDHISKEFLLFGELTKSKTLAFDESFTSVYGDLQQYSEQIFIFKADLIKYAKFKAIDGILGFINGLYSMYSLITSDLELEGIQGAYLILKWIEAVSNTILGAVTFAYAKFLLREATNIETFAQHAKFADKFDNILSKAGKFMKWFGYALQIFMAGIDIWQTLETFKGFTGFIIINILLIGLETIAGIIAFEAAPATYGISIIVYVILIIFFFPWLNDWYASVATPEMDVIEEESGVFLPDQNIKRHGGLEVGDPVTYKLVLKNTGGDRQRTYVRAKLEIGGVDTGYVGKWRDSWPGLKGINDIGPCYRRGQKFDTPLTINIPKPTENLVANFTLEIGGAQEIAFYWDRTKNLYGPKTTPINFEIPVLQNNIADFFADTREIPGFKSIEMLESDLNLAISQYKWKDAHEILNRIKLIDPDYPLNLPTITNIDTNLKKDSLKIDPSIGEISTNFRFDVEGWDNPMVDYKFIAPEDFSISPNYFPKQSLLGYQGTHNFDYEMKQGYYYGTYDFNYEMEEGLYYGTYDFRLDKLGRAPNDWGTSNPFGSKKNFVSVEESVGGHKKVVSLYDGDNKDDWAFAALSQMFHESQSSGTIEYWFRTDNAEKTTYMLVGEDSDDEILLKVESNQVHVFTYFPFFPYEPYWVPMEIEVENDNWVHFRITFECGSGNYDELPADMFNIYINGVKLSFPFYFITGDAIGLNSIIFRTEGIQGWYSSWFDAIGYSWDDWSHDEIGYKIGWNTHPYDLVPFINDGWKFNPNIGCSVKIVNELDGHKNVMDLFDNSGSAIINMKRDIFPIQTSGTVESWWRVSDTQKGIAMGLGFNSLYGPRVYVRSNKFQYYDGSYHEIKSGVLENKWYHIRIDFESGDSGYKELSADSFYVYINGDKYGPFPFHNSLSAINEFGIWSSTSNYGYHAYFDAIGYSWDTWSHEGLGYKQGRNINHFDIEPLLKDGFEDIQLKNWGKIESKYVNSITTINEIDGHNNVLTFHYFNETPTKLYKYFNAQTSGTVEWWMRTESTNYQTVLGIGSDISIGFSNHLIAFYSNGWSYTEIPVDENTWYHFRIDFECEDSGYEGLSADSFYVYINGDKYGPFPFPNPIAFIDYIYMEMKEICSFEYGDPFSSYFDGIGFSWDNNYIIGGNLNKGLNFNLIATNPEEVIAGTYYFTIEIRLNETGELIFFDQIPFEVLVSRDLEYSQSNIIFRDMLNLGLNQNSPLYTESKNLNIGNIFNIKCKTDTTNEILLDLLYNGQITKQLLVLPRGNLNFEEQFIQILVDEPVSFNQLNFSGNLEDNEEFVIHEILIMDSSMTIPSEEIFNPINLTNNGNVPEFIAFSFSGVPFDFVDTSLYPDEFQVEKQVFTLMPGESKRCLFKISDPIESISNLYSRGIIAKHPITNDIYLSYIDNFRTDGIYIDSPKNVTYNNFGVLDQGIQLSIITEEELVWIAYSLDNQPFIEFSDNKIIPIPEKSGTHKIQVFGRDSVDNLFISEPRYFSVEYALKMTIPENTTYYEPMNGYYIATFGFENEKPGTSGKNIDFIDKDTSTGNSQVVVLEELDGHKMILDCHNTQYGKWQILHAIEEDITSGTIEFYWRTHSLSVSPWIFSFLDKYSKWGAILYQNKLDGGDLWYWDNVGFHDLDFKPSIDTWHHFRIDIDVVANKWDLFIDGRIKGTKLPFHALDIINIGYIYLQGQNRYAFHTYYDAISFSWDDNYKVGDNLKEGVLFSYSSNPLNIDQVQYSLDGGEKQTFSDETVILLPKNGLHSMKFYAARPCGEIIQSELTQFTVARYIDILTPECKLYAAPMSALYKATFGFEDNDLSPWINGGFKYEEIIPYKGGHKNILHLKNVFTDPYTISPAIFSNKFPSRSNGTIELWHYPDFNVFTDVIAPKNHLITLGGGNLYIDSFGSYFWKYKGATRFIMPFAVNHWNHISFNFQNGTVKIRINNLFKITASIDNNIDSLNFLEYRAREMWVDAIGYSWDPNYNVGDNKKEGLLLSLNYPSDIELQEINYSLDGQDNVTIYGNTVIARPIPGTHSIQVFGTDLEGYKYESELRYFSYLQEEFATPLGMNVKIFDPKTGIEILFTQIISSGTTTIEKLEDTALSLPIGTKKTEQFYEISTTSSNQGTIFISIPYDALLVEREEKDLRLFKYVENLGWVDITTSIDTINDIIYGETSSLSVFAILEPDTTEPIIIIDYHDGDRTDGNPGLWNVFAYDPESDINYSTINILIDGGFAGNVFGDYPVPNTIGEHTIFVEVQNNNTYKARSSSESYPLVIEDDDTTPPDIGIGYFGGCNDSSPGYFEWVIIDFDSGISKIEISIQYNSTEGLPDQIYTIENPTESGTWNLPKSLGFYTITINTTDNDDDTSLVIDSLSSNLTKVIEIIDDDVINPLITNVAYETIICDGNTEIIIEINATDTSGISEVFVDFMGSIYPAYLYNDLYIVAIPNPIFLGEYNFTVIVWDADNDRFDTNNINIDRLSSTQLHYFYVIDDDIQPPELSDLTILDNTLEIDITFKGVDDSSGDDQGLRKIYIYVDDELILSYDASPTETYFNFILPNNWIMKYGTHHVTIKAYDADNDRTDDSLSSIIKGTFEITFDEMKQYVIWEIDRLIEKIQESPDNYWSKKNGKATMCNKLIELKNLISNHNFKEAYDKLLHDIKPKLTGLKTNEYEEPWGGGVFKNPWVINNTLQEEFCLFCNDILTHIPLLKNSLSASKTIAVKLNSADNIGFGIYSTINSQILGFTYFLLIIGACMVTIYLLRKRRRRSNSIYLKD